VRAPQRVHPAFGDPRRVRLRAHRAGRTAIPRYVHPGYRDPVGAPESKTLVTPLQASWMHEPLQGNRRYGLQEALRGAKRPCGRLEAPGGRGRFAPLSRSRGVHESHSGSQGPVLRVGEASANLPFRRWEFPLSEWTLSIQDPTSECACCEMRRLCRSEGKVLVNFGECYRHLSLHVSW
jgi:hypothetical protein